MRSPAIDREARDVCAIQGIAEPTLASDQTLQRCLEQSPPLFAEQPWDIPSQRLGDGTITAALERRRE